MREYDGETLGVSLTEAVYEGLPVGDAVTEREEEPVELRVPELVGDGVRLCVGVWLRLLRTMTVCGQGSGSRRANHNGV